MSLRTFIRSLTNKARRNAGAHAVLDRAVAPLFEGLEERRMFTLLGLPLEFPRVAYDLNGVLNYTYDANTDTGSFDVTATPKTFKASSLALSTAISGNRSLNLHFKTDGTGENVTGVAGDDFVITGDVDVDNNGTIDYSGVLLTGEVNFIGFDGSGSTTAQFDFSIMPTGGALVNAGYFPPSKDIALRMTSNNSTFVDFSNNFVGGAEGTFAPTPAVGRQLLPSSLSGYVYHDLDVDGHRDAGEAGIAGVTLELSGFDNYNMQPVTAFVTTDANGFYSFTNVAPGNYTIKEYQPAGYVDGGEEIGTQGGVANPSGANDLLQPITIPLTGGVNGVENNFGELKLASIGGYVYQDNNNNGLKEMGENGIGGVKVTLTGTDMLGQSVSMSTNTLADGSYAFGNLLPGTYSLVETQPAGYVDGKDTQGTPGTGVTGNDVFGGIVLLSGVNGANNNFGELFISSLGGFVYHDVNNNGLKEMGEAGIAGAKITLTGTDVSGASISLTTMTLADGSYNFPGLLPGTYTLSETQPAGYIDGKDKQGTPGTGVAGNDVFSNIVLAPSVSGANNNFGELKPSSIGGFVYVDANNNGIREATESTISMTLITLSGTNDLGQAVTLTTQTDNLGAYLFTDLRPGNYSILETQPAGFQDGIDKVGTINGIATGTVPANDKLSLALPGGVSGINYNFGERFPSPLVRGDTGTIGFWRNSNGQALLLKLNGSSTSVKLGNWLATNFPKLWGKSAPAAQNMTNKTNAQVANFYVQFFDGLFNTPNPKKTECQALAVAFAMYSTSSTLAGGTYAAAFGLNVSSGGIGGKQINVMGYGAAFGMNNNTSSNMLNLLKLLDARTTNGIIHASNASYRQMANDLLSAINEMGDRY